MFNSINLETELEFLSTKIDEVSINGSNPNSQFNIKINLENNWHVYMKTERDKISFEREYLSENEAKKYLVDLIRVMENKSTLHCFLNNEKEFNSGKNKIIILINKEIENSNYKKKLIVLKKHVEKLNYESCNVIIDRNSKLKNYFISNSILFNKQFSENLLFFIHSIK